MSEAVKAKLVSTKNHKKVKWQLANQESERKRAYKFGLDSFIYGIITSRPTPIVPLHSPTTQFSLTLDDEKVSYPLKTTF
jgi:hypothetical protein